MQLKWLVNVIGKHQPIVKAAEQLAGHYVRQYTQGLTAAVEHGLSSVVTPLAAQALRTLPDATTKFASFAPALKEITKTADQLRRVPASLAVARGVAPRPLPPSSVRAPPHLLPIHLAMRRAP